MQSPSPKLHCRDCSFARVPEISKSGSAGRLCTLQGGQQDLRVHQDTWKFTAHSENTVSARRLDAQNDDNHNGDADDQNTCCKFHLIAELVLLHGHAIAHVRSSSGRWFSIRAVTASVIALLVIVFGREPPIGASVRYTNRRNSYCERMPYSCDLTPMLVTWRFSLAASPLASCRSSAGRRG
jgi:hypothetical protein